MEGSEALVQAAIAAGCRFFAGYPMTPFTEVLEHFARLLPDVGGVRQRGVGARSRRHGVGRARNGARAATGSTGQGLSLMQESFSEITLAELPLVIFNMARGQQDYYQATRRRSRRLPAHRARTARHQRRRRARAARVPPRRQVAQPRARLRRLPPRPHPGGGRGRDRPLSPRSAEGLGRRRQRERVGPVARRHAARSLEARAEGLRPGGPRSTRRARSRTWSARCASRPRSSTTPRP